MKAGSRKESGRGRWAGRACGAKALNVGTSAQVDTCPAILCFLGRPRRGLSEPALALSLGKVFLSHEAAG